MPPDFEIFESLQLIHGRLISDNFPMTNTPTRLTLPGLLTLITLMASALAFRLPVLINPERMNSDHAFLGLQALRILDGEWSWFLWMSDYQGTWEPMVAAILFKIFGVSFSSLQWTPLSAYMLLLGMLLVLLANEVGWIKSFGLCLLWVFAARPFIDTNVLPYRQWSIFFPVFALFLIFRKGAGPGGLAIAGLLLLFALYVDFFSLQFLLPVLAVGVLSAQSSPKHLGAFAAGVVIGGTFVVATRFLGPESGAPLAFSPKTVLHNLPLFFGTCLPVLLGFAFPADDHGRVSIGDGINRYLVFSTALLFLLVGRSIYLTFTDRSLPRAVKLLGVFGTLLLGQSSVGFLGSSMASNLQSVRYLTPFIYSLPFALLPVAYRMNRRVLALCLLPVLAGIAVGGWLQYGPLVAGIKPVRDPGGWVQSAKTMGRWLRTQDIQFGFSQYWVAYQLTFLYDENPVIAPNDIFNRYPAYTQRAAQAHRLARIYTPTDHPADVLNFEKTHGTKIKARWDMNGFTALVYEQ